MPHYLAPGLTPEAATDICMNQCRAMCCRTPYILRLSASEMVAFKARAISLGVPLTIEPTADGVGWVRFSVHPGEHCPMLDDATSACRIYGDRPQRCREFPESLTPGCAISGG
ncbi:MAG: YkgJ family cysteine cluster protein [Chloroflexi bacterium]|nr:YkgJ family cysteine cluster protein [Chloroflexota bacterium]